MIVSIERFTNVSEEGCIIFFCAMKVHILLFEMFVVPVFVAAMLLQTCNSAFSSATGRF